MTTGATATTTKISVHKIGQCGFKLNKETKCQSQDNMCLQITKQAGAVVIYVVVEFHAKQGLVTGTLNPKQHQAQMAF